MSEGLRAEDVKEALEVGIDSPDAVRRNIAYATVFAAARDHLQCLASQEQTPDYEAAIARWKRKQSWLRYASEVGPVDIRDIVDAALVGFHPQPTEEER